MQCTEVVAGEYHQERSHGLILGSGAPTNVHSVAPQELRFSHSPEWYLNLPSGKQFRNARTEFGAGADYYELVECREDRLF